MSGLTVLASKGRDCELVTTWYQTLQLFFTLMWKSVLSKENNRNFVSWKLQMNRERTLIRYDELVDIFLGIFEWKQNKWFDFCSGFSGLFGLFCLWVLFGCFFWGGDVVAVFWGFEVFFKSCFLCSLASSHQKFNMVLLVGFVYLVSYTFEKNDAKIMFKWKCTL